MSDQGIAITTRSAPGALARHFNDGVKATFGNTAAAPRGQIYAAAPNFVIEGVSGDVFFLRAGGTKAVLTSTSLYLLDNVLGGRGSGGPLADYAEKYDATNYIRNVVSGIEKWQAAGVDKIKMTAGQFNLVDGHVASLGTGFFGADFGRVYDGADLVDTLVSGDHLFTGPVLSKKRIINTDIESVRHHLADSFIETAALYGTQWDLSNFVGGGTNAISATLLGGQAVLTTGAIAGNHECTQSDNPVFSRSLNPHMHVHFELDGDLNGKQVSIGFSDAPLGGEASFGYLFFDFSNDAVNFWHKEDGGGDASLGAGPTADVSYDVDISITAAGALRIEIPDLSIDTTVAGAVGANTGMHFFVAIETEGAVAEVLICSHLEAWWD